MLLPSTETLSLAAAMHMTCQLQRHLKTAMTMVAQLSMGSLAVTAHTTMARRQAIPRTLVARISTGTMAAATTPQGTMATLQAHPVGAHLRGTHKSEADAEMQTSCRAYQWRHSCFLCKAKQKKDCLHMWAVDGKSAAMFIVAHALIPCMMAVIVRSKCLWRACPAVTELGQKLADLKRDAISYL
jgi:hypothetical protein